MAHHGPATRMRKKVCCQKLSTLLITPDSACPNESSVQGVSPDVLTVLVQLNVPVHPSCSMSVLNSVSLSCDPNLHLSDHWS